MKRLIEETCLKSTIEKIKNEIFIEFTSGRLQGYEDVGKIGGISVRCYEYELETKDIYLGTYYVPLKYMYTIDKFLMLFCLENHKEILFDVIKKYQEDLFSQDCIDDIHNRISDDLQKSFNIFPDLSLDYHDIIYAITNKNELNLSAKQNTTVKFDEKTEYDVICTQLDKTKPSVFYGTLIEGKIVSLAELVYGSDDGIAYIGYVCTHKDYRGKGCALSNVVALAEDALNNGKIVIYGSGSANTASKKTALSAGLTEICKLKSYWCQKNEK